MPIFYWLQAARIPSIVNIVIPILVGVSLSKHTLQLSEFLWILGVSFLYSLFIVFLNDAADLKADENNLDYTLYSGGSRVIQEKKLTKETIFRAGITIAGILVVSIGVFSIISSNYLLVLYPIAAVLLLYSYSFPPLKLNYKGGGEVLQGLGCGVLLPMFGYSFFTQQHFFSLSILLPYFFLHVSSSIGSSIPDSRSDLESGKKTLSALFGREIGSLIAAIIVVATTIAVYLLSPTQTSTYLFFGFMFPLMFSVIQCILIPLMKRNKVAVFFSGMLPVLSVVSYSFGIILP